MGAGADRVWRGRFKGDGAAGKGPALFRVPVRPGMALPCGPAAKPQGKRAARGGGKPQTALLKVVGKKRLKLTLCIERA